MLYSIYKFINHSQKFTNKLKYLYIQLLVVIHKNVFVKILYVFKIAYLDAVFILLNGKAFLMYSENVGT